MYFKKRIYLALQFAAGSTGGHLSRNREGEMALVKTERDNCGALVQQQLVTRVESNRRRSRYSSCVAVCQQRLQKHQA
jgi:hypothetical protein